MKKQTPTFNGKNNRHCSLRQQQCQQQFRQQGAALITGLIFLVLLTILGFSSTRGVIMQELLSRNFSDQRLALQAAESALKYAEACIRTTNALPRGGINTVEPKCVGSVQLSPYTDAVLESGNISYWTSVGTQYGLKTGELPLSMPNGALAQQPRFLVAVLNAADCAAGTPTCQYQISAWGTGQNPNTQKIVQSIFIP